MHMLAVQEEVMLQRTCVLKLLNTWAMFQLRLHPSVLFAMQKTHVTWTLMSHGGVPRLLYIPAG